MFVTYRCDAVKLSIDQEQISYNNIADLTALEIDLTKYSHQSSLGIFDRFKKDDPKAWIDKGKELERLVKYEEAVACYTKALSIEPNHSGALNHKAKALSNLGRYDESYECYDKLTRLTRNDAGAWANRASILLKLHFPRYEEAMFCVDESLKLEPNNFLAEFTKGSIQYNLGKYEEAEKCFDKTIKLNPKDAKAWTHKGRTLRKLGKLGESIQCLDESLKLEPLPNLMMDRPPMFNCGTMILYEIRLSIERLEIDRYEEARECYNEINKLCPDDYQVWVRLGHILNRLGYLGEADKCYNEVNRLNPDYYHDHIKKKDDPLTVLRFRFASGEITEEEYILMKKN